MAIRVVTFDVDGTLMRRFQDVPTLKVDAIDHAVRKVFGLKGFNYLDHLKPDMFGMTDRSILRMLLRRLGVNGADVDGRIDEMLDESMAFFNSHPGHTCDKDYYLLPGAEKALAALKQHGIAMGLATGNYSGFAQWKVDGLGIGDYFTFGGFGDDAEDRADIIGIALNRANSNGAPAMHFGDTPVDIHSAHRNGIMAGAISARGGATFESQALYDAGADLVIDSWADIDSIIDFLDR